MIDYRALSDEDKIELLRLLYSNIKLKADERNLIIAETMTVYKRIKNKLN